MSTFVKLFKTITNLFKIMLNLKYLSNNNQISFVLLAIGIFVFRCLFSSWIIDQFRDDNIFVLRAFYYPQSKL